MNAHFPDANRHNIWRVTLALLLCLAGATLTHAQPANNHFTNAAVLSGTNGFVNGSNVGANKEPGEPNHAGNSGGLSVWYSWQAPATGPVNFYTFGSSFDTLLAVYTGSAVNALTFVASNDDEGGTVQSFVQFAAVAGTMYRIAVDGWGGEFGNILLSWQYSTPPPPSMAIVSAGPLTNIIVAPDGSFQVRHVLFANGQIYPTDEDLADSGFFVRQPGGIVSGPDFTNRVSAAEGTLSRKFHPISQSISSNGLAVTMVMDNRNDGSANSFQVTQVTSYRPGDEYFTVQNTISNMGASSFSADLFAAADLYLADSDFGFGFINPGVGIVGGSDSGRVFHIFIQNQPGNPVPAFYQEDSYDTIWDIVGTPGQHFVNTISSEYLDNGAGIEWPNVTLAPGSPLTVTYLWSFGTAADLGVALMGSPDPVNVGTNLTYQALVTNTGPGTATNVVLVDTLPANVSFVFASSTSGSCTYSGGTITCYLNPIAPGESNLVTIVVQPNASGTISNGVSVSGSQADVNLANNSSVFLVMAAAGPPPPPGITVDLPTDLNVNLSSNLTLSITATGAPPLSYQWFFDRTNVIAGATSSSFTITNAQLKDIGEYEVEVTNPGGSVSSTRVFVFVRRFDFGDAPNAYKTLLADDGPRHRVRVMPDRFLLSLGFSIDAETDGQPNSTATGDDNNAAADEDGVSFSTPITAGEEATITVFASHAARLDAWIDFNANNSWADANEKIFNNKVLKAGFNTLKFNVPAGATIGNTFGRFRLSTTGGLGTTGEASDGEVEDHSISIRPAATAGVGVRGPFVFKNTSGFDAASIEVIFVGTGGALTTPWITMEPEDANGVATFPAPVGNRNRVVVTFQNKVRKGGMVAFTVQAPNTIGVDSVEWSDGAGALFSGALHANLDRSQPIPWAPFDLRFRVRKSYKNYTAAELDLLVEAMQMLHDPAKAPPRDALGRLSPGEALKPGDPHDRYEEYVLMHDLNQNTAHGGSHFTPWHRKLLLDFENDLRALAPKFKDLTVPFWDWTLNDNNPFSDFLGGNGNPADVNRVAGGPFGKTQNQWRTYAYQFSVKNWQRGYLKRAYQNANFNASQLRLDAPDGRNWALTNSDYAGFRRAWEHDPGTHDPAHVWVGGDLGNPTRGVNEPGFWLLHSFIDETWAEWQCKWGHNTFTALPATHGADRPMKGFPSAPPANAMFNFLTLGFTYERAGKRIDDPMCKVPRLPRLIINFIYRVLSDPAKGGGGGAEDTFGFTAEGGIGFQQIETSTDLVSWMPLQSFLASNTVTGFGNTNIPIDPHRFFRVRPQIGGPSGNAFVIDAFSGGGGQISPEGITVVNGGGSQAFLAQPAPGMAVDKWYLDGTPVQSGGNSFSLNNVQTDHSVSVGFHDLAAPVANLVVSMTPSLTVASNAQPVTYSVTISNAGPDAANGVTVMFEPEDMPAFNDILVSQGTFAVMGEPPHVHGLMFSAGNLAVGSNATLTVTLEHDEAGPLTSQAWASAEERDPIVGNNEASATLTIAGSPDRAKKSRVADPFCGPGLPRRW